MAENSAIEWTHHTFNPWLGCAKVHAGCTHCYAETRPAVVLRKGGRVQWGEVWQGGQRVVVADSTWAQPMSWARAAARAGERHRVFCASLADVLEVPNEEPAFLRTSGHHDRVIAVRHLLDVARARLWDVIQTTSACQYCGARATCMGQYEAGGFGGACNDCCGHGNEDGWCNPSGLDWLLLTKRPEHWRLVPEAVRPLVWLGTSVSTQETATEWMLRLMEAQGFRYRYLSLEPLLGPVNLGLMGTVPASISPAYRPVASMIDWVIVGGESGSKARPCHVEWVRDIVRQCREAGVPCFVKQLGAVPVLREEPTGNFRTHPETGKRQVQSRLTLLDVNDKKGGDTPEWPEDLRVRQLPEVHLG